MSSSTNINCRHRQLINKESKTIDFCKKCSCFLSIKYGKQKEVVSFSIVPKRMITPSETSPYESILKLIKESQNSNLSCYFKSIPNDYLQMRKHLITYLKDYIVLYKYSSRSYFLAVHIMDSIYCKHPYDEFICKLKPDVLTLAIFLVSVKFIDDDAYPPSFDSFPSKKNPTIYYSLNELRRYELIVLKLMDYKLDICTTYYITETILTHGVIFSHELNQMGLTDSKSVKETVKKLYRLALDINKMFIESVESLKYSPLEIAVTSIIMAKELTSFSETWNPELAELYQIRSVDTLGCYSSILR